MINTPTGAPTTALAARIAAVLRVSGSAQLPGLDVHAGAEQASPDVRDDRRAGHLGGRQRREHEQPDRHQHPAGTERGDPDAANQANRRERGERRGAEVDQNSSLSVTRAD